MKTGSRWESEALYGLLIGVGWAVWHSVDQGWDVILGGDQNKGFASLGLTFIGLALMITGVRGIWIRAALRLVPSLPQSSPDRLRAGQLTIDFAARTFANGVQHRT